MLNPNGSSMAASVTCPESAAVKDANTAIRCRAVPRWWRPSTFATTAFGWCGGGARGAVALTGHTAQPAFSHS